VLAYLYHKIRANPETPEIKGISHCTLCELMQYFKVTDAVRQLLHINEEKKLSESLFNRFR